MTSDDQTEPLLDRRPRRGTSDGSVRPAVRIAAVVGALGWAILFFGVIDVSVVLLHDERFHDFYLLETGWGLLYTLLVAFPLVSFAVRPQSAVALQQVFVVAAAVFACALITPATAQIAPALLLAMTALGLAGGSGHGWAPRHGLTFRKIDNGMAFLTLVAAVGACAYAVRVIHAARTGEPEEETLGLMHLPMQAAFGLSVAGTAGISMLARAAHSSGWRIPAISAAVCAVWFGLVSLAYPNLLASPGRPAGIATICWGVALAGICTRKDHGPA